MAEVNGKDALIYFNISGTYVEYGCAESISFSSDAELIETSTEGTGVDATFDYQRLTHTISLTGVMQNISGNVTVWDMLLQQRGFLAVPYRIVFTDNSGNVKTISGNAVIPNVNMTAEQSDFATGGLELQGTGEPDILDDVPVPIITIEGTGAGTGAIETLILRDPSTLAEWTFVGSVAVGQTETWVLNGSGGQPGAGEYFIEAVVSSDQPTNHFIVDAPPTANVSVGSGSTNLDTAPFGNTVAFDFTTNRTITFLVGS